MSFGWWGNLDSDFLYSAINGIGKETLMWAPVAIGLATDNPTILAVSEMGYAAFQLYAAYNSQSKAGLFSALSNAAVSLITPFTYHPALSSQISASTRAQVLLGIGGNNILRGASEIALATSNLACKAYARALSEEVDIESGGVIGNALRLGLGALRVYSGTKQINSGLSELSVEQPELEGTDFQESPKMDPQNAKYEFKRKVSSDGASPKMDSKHAKEIFRRPSNSKSQAKNKCFLKSGTHREHDIAFYKRASDPKTPSIATEGRCEGTLYLRSEDTNYLHEKDSSYLRAEDTRPIGEMKSEVIDALIQDGRVWVRTVEKVRDICREIEKVHASGGKIKRMILVGHGNVDKMSLREEAISSSFFEFLTGSRTTSGLDSYALDTKSVFPKNGCLKYLEPDADIILIGCKTGQKIHGGKTNLADALAHQAPGHKVFAPVFSTSFSEFNVREKNGDLDFYFKDSFAEHTYIAEEKISKRRSPR